MLGGAQSLHTNSRDEALGLPTPEAARLALRTQQVIAYESGVTAAPDPLGGSEYIEELTDEIERGAEAYIARIDKMGGTLRAIEEGFIQREIQNAAYESQEKIESGESIVVGVNRFEEAASAPPPVFRVDPPSSSGKSSASASCAPPAIRTCTRSVSTNWKPPPAAPRT